MMEMTQRDRESPAWTILLRMPQIRMLFLNLLKSEDCVAILYSCMKKLKEEMRKVLQMCEKTKEVKLKAKAS